jgi:hypothetical protein
MTRSAFAATLPGSRWAVLALLTATAALAFDAGRTSCNHTPAHSPHGSHNAPLFAR